MVLQPVKKRNRPMDESSMGMRIGVLSILGFFLFGVLAFRLWDLQILTGDQYVASASTNMERKIPVEAPRGVIYDRNGQLLVTNRGGLSVGLLPMEMKSPKTDLSGFESELSNLASVLGMSKDDLATLYTQAAKNPFVDTVVKEDVSMAPVVDYLKEHSLDFPGVEVQAAVLRSYPDKSLAAQVLGYVGKVTQNELNQSQFSQLPLSDHVGQDGVESTYDRYLRGQDGHQTVEVDASGHPVQYLEDVPPTPGDNLTLTIDADLQKAAESALAQGISQAHLQGFKQADGGAVVALDPRTGQVLAMASYPTYDPSLWAGGMSAKVYAQLNSKEANDPFFNRAIAGLYPAGSTFKPFVAATGLDAGVITPNSTFFCPGKFSLLGTVWKDWNPAPLGNVSLAQALEESVDVYFYNLGYKLYQQTGSVLQDGLAKFGFGQQTGIDLPGESAGQVGKTSAQETRTPGKDINLAIGQGDLLVTPLQLAVGFSAIANGGQVWIPHMSLQLTDASGNVVHQFEDQQAGKIDISPSNLEAIKRGLGLVVSSPNGTAYQVFKGFPIAVAGKTGTAQMPPGDAEAWFAGYAPADNPQIVVVALVEHGGHGSSVAAPIVRSVMEAYFHTNSSSTGAIKATE